MPWPNCNDGQLRLWVKQGLHNVFAVGDCTATLEEKNALAADLGASLAVINIRALASKRDMALFPQVRQQCQHMVVRVHSLKPVGVHMVDPVFNG